MRRWALRAKGMMMGRFVSFLTSLPTALLVCAAAFADTSFTLYDRDYPFFVQHLVTNKIVGVITDMTTMCRMN